MVRRRADSHVVSVPGRAGELTSQHLDEVRLHEDHRGELVVRAELELRVVAACVAVVAGVRAAAIGIERPLEGHALHGVERRPALDLLISRRVGAPNRFGQCIRTPGPDECGDLPSGGFDGAEIE
jgi:hypothetical protein